MAQLNHRFQVGRMNKDLDERLVPNGEYRNALNAQVSTSEDSNIGSLQTIMGNLGISSTIIDPEGTNLFDFYCVGSIVDEKEDRIYWLISGIGKDIIAEYNYKNGAVSPVVVDIFDSALYPSNESGRVLNFDRSFLITGINIIDDHLFWTDNNTEPKKINITRSKIGSPDFNTHTDLFVKNLVNPNPPYVSAGPLEHEYVTVIKKSPRTAPLLEMKNTTRPDANTDGSIVIFTTLSASVYSDFVDPLTGGFRETAITVTFDTIPDFSVDDFLTISSSTHDFVVEIVGGTPSVNGVCDIKIISWSSNINETEFDETMHVSLNQNEALFQFKFPRFGYRYKYEDGEYSAFSPFSEVAFLPSEFDYLPKEGYNLGMVNSVRYLGVKDFVDMASIPDDVISIDILYKESNSPNIYSVKTVDRIDDNETNYNEWNAVGDSSSMFPLAFVGGFNDKTKGFVNIKSEMIHAILPSNQLLRPWDNVPRKALTQEIVGNRLVYGNYLQNYNLDTTVDLRLSIASKHVGSSTPEQIFPSEAYNYSPAKSIKSLRTYQLGVVYIDEFGRETPILSNSIPSSKNTIHVDKIQAPLASKLTAQMFNTPPAWAKAFKYFIKETSNEYYNLSMDRWYPAEDGNIWLSFPSSERNKVDLETFLILKKAHNASNFVPERARYKILALENEAPIFLKTKREAKGRIYDAALSPGPGFVIGQNAPGIGFPFPDGTFIYIDGPTFDLAHIGIRLLDEGDTLSDYEFRVYSSSEGASKWYGIKSLEKDAGSTQWKLVPKEKFGVDMGITTPDLNTSTMWGNRHLDCVIEFVKREVKNRPEFDGRFFAKILKDSAVSTYIIGDDDNADEYVVTNAIQSQYINPQASSVLSGGPYSNAFLSDNWYGFDENKISISNANDAGAHHPIGGGVGEDYWGLAGRTPNTNSTSSGWFIDRVEAFRNFMYTKLYFNGTDPSLRTNQDAGNSLAAFSVLYSAFNYEPSDPPVRMQLIGTNTHIYPAADQYLGIANLLAPGSALNNAPPSEGGAIAKSIGIGDSSGVYNTIHLSYTGVGIDHGPLDSFTLNFSPHFGSASWAANYVEEQAFADAITLPGTIWRWKEDPDQVVYKTVAQPATSNQTPTEWVDNVFDTIDGELGVALWNYTSFADYSIKHRKSHKYYDWFQNGDFLSCGGMDHTAWVSQGYTNHHFDYGGGGPINTAPAFTACVSGYLFELGNTSVINVGNEQILAANNTSGGWELTGSHKRYPFHLGNHGLASSKRRRFQIAAVTKDDSTIGLGGVAPHFYLPTNDPDFAPHFDNTATPLTTASFPNVAPGIRPDGMYSGHDLPGVASYTLNNSAGTAIDYTTIPSLRMTDGTNESPAPGTVTWEILSTYIEDSDGSTYSSTDPAVWETEPKEDIGLEIYHEVGQVYNVGLDETNVDQLIGPVHELWMMNSRVTCVDAAGTNILLSTNTGSPGQDDIRVYMVDHSTGFARVLLVDANIATLDNTAASTATFPPSGSTLIFTRADGSSTRTKMLNFDPGGGGIGGYVGATYTLRFDIHKYEVALPWFNCYSFGNGVESDRIRDDYNQVTIDNGPKVSTTLEEPYAEEHRSSGLIYSGIYNSMSGVNNLNQFIQAEKITKDLNPIYGTIQKLYTRNTNLLTFCEDKVFKILADKDAIYNADGNPQLTATENVLGQTIPFAGDFGISKNPESFAVDGYRIYFSDRARGAVLRLSQDGLSAISDIGMTDWFADNLTTSNRVIGSFDDKKGEYNISLSYYNFDSHLVAILGHARLPGDPYVPSPRLLCSYGVASQLQIGDEVIGIGIPPNTTIVDIINMGGGDWHIVLSQAPSLADVIPLNPWEPYGPVPQTGILDVMWKTRIRSSKVEMDSTTLSFSENSKGWVSFKSFIPENGVSLNNNYYTFNKGQLWQHHDESSATSDTSAASTNSTTLQMVTLPSITRVGLVVVGEGIEDGTLIQAISGLYVTLSLPASVRLGTSITFSAPTNNFYSTSSINNQYDSSVEVLFNEASGSVKSFQSLNYEGSKSRITADINNSGEYWDNNNKLGWYVSKIFTDLQEGDIHEFKDKEGKWFSQIKGVATEWLDDGTAGNIDTNEFSYQGIDNAGAIVIVDGGFTSWNCASEDGFSCVEISGLGGAYTSELTCTSDPNGDCYQGCLIDNVVSANAVNGNISDCGLGGSISVNVQILTGAASWTVKYDLNGSSVSASDSTTYTYDGTSGVFPLGDYGDWTATITDSNGCISTIPFTIECTTPVCTEFLHTAIVAPTSSTLPHCNNGEVMILMQNLVAPSSSWTIEYFLVTSGIPSSIFEDATVYANGASTQYSNLAPGDYEVVITDDLGCSETYSFIIDCVAFTCNECYGGQSGGGCCDSNATNYNAAALCDDNSCTYPGCPSFTWGPNYITDATGDCDDGHAQVSIGAISPFYPWVAEVWLGGNLIQTIDDNGGPFTSNNASLGIGNLIPGGYEIWLVFDIQGTPTRCLAGSFTITCTTSVCNSQTSVPDENFEYFLESHQPSYTLSPNAPGQWATTMGNGIGFDHLVCTEKLVGTTLWINSLNIANLAGIEAFTALTYLNCNENNLTSLNISNLNLTGLDTLQCSENQLTSLDVSACTGLTFLNCASQNGLGLSTLIIGSSISLTGLTVMDAGYNANNLVIHVGAGDVPGTTGGSGAGGLQTRVEYATATYTLGNGSITGATTFAI